MNIFDLISAISFKMNRERSYYYKMKRYEYIHYILLNDCLCCLFTHLLSHSNVRLRNLGELKVSQDKQIWFNSINFRLFCILKNIFYKGHMKSDIIQLPISFKLY